MSNLSIRSSQPVTLAQQTQRSAPKHQLKELAAPEMAKDKVDIRKGLTPTLKGAAAGGIGMGGGTALLLGAEKLAIGTPFLDFSPYIITAAAAGGTLGGIAAANTTDSKGKGALIGAGAGAAAGAVALGLFARGSGDALALAAIGGAIGAVTGAGGGFFGSMVAEQK